MKDTQWLYSIVRPVVKGQYNDSQYNRDMNLLFIKLHLLDPTAVFPAYDHLRKGSSRIFHDQLLQRQSININLLTE